jgi:hypothetical protein
MGSVYTRQTMLIATSLVAAALIAAPAASRPPAAALLVDVAVAPDVPGRLVSHALEETKTIWRLSGVTLVWNRLNTWNEPEGSRTATGPIRPLALPRLRIAIGSDRWAPATSPNVTPLAWILFEADAPQQEIYVSYANAATFMANSELVVGRLDNKTIAERETLMGRAMGRALAHEVGHYLLRSKAHAGKGLMRAMFTAAELFTLPRHGVTLAVEEQRLLDARLRATAAVADVRAVR